ncbi:MAG: response regulator [Thermoguttaceae bacterium]
MPKSTSALAGKVDEVLRQQPGDVHAPVLEEIRRLTREIEIQQRQLEDENEALKAAQQHLKAYRDRYIDLYDFAPVGYVTLDEEGYVQEINLTGAGLLGAEREALTGYPFEDYVLAEDRPALLGHLRRCASERCEVTCQLRLVSARGKAITAHLRSIPIEGPADETLCKTAITDITELRRTEEALQQAKADAERANQAKSRLLAYVSHDLRTPINTILGMVELALERTAEPAAKDFLQTAKGSADVLLVLLNDLVDSTSMEAGKPELEAVPFSLRRVLDRVKRVLAFWAPQKGVTWCCRVAPEVPDGVIGDQVRLRQVLLNLAENVMGSGGQEKLTLSVRAQSQDGGEVSLAFALGDADPDAPADEQQNTFQQFAQAEGAVPRRFGEGNLGLAVAASLAVAMNGRIWAERRPTAGSLFHFTVRLPLAPETPAPTETATPRWPFPTSPLRILLVEDHPAHQVFAAQVLRDRGHAVEIAGSGGLALRMAEQNRYDAILMDLEMPGLDGLEVTAAIRSREDQQRRVPIIAVTAHAMKGDSQRCRQAGMDGYLAKPIDAHRLTVMVESLAVGHQAPAQKEPAAAPAPAGSDVFDPEAAMQLCFGRQEMFQTMVRSFLDDVQQLLPQMQSALQGGDLAQLGQLGHRFRGTVTYLGARRAADAASRVERFGRPGDTTDDPQEAIESLRRECDALARLLPRL